MNLKTQTSDQVTSIDFFRLLALNQSLSQQNERLAEENVRLKEENKKLSLRLLEIEERLNTNSNNSSKAPSQDPFRKTKHSQPSGRKPGGQPGHPAATRKMLPPDKVNRIIEIKPEICSHCGAVMTETDSISVKHRQVVELSLVSPNVTQYNVHTCRCKTCGKRVNGEIPQEARRSFGPRLMAFLTMLSGEASVTKRKICTIMGHLGIKISLGSLCNIHRLAATLLEKPFEEIRSVALQSSNMNADESSWRYKHNKCWLWIGATPVATFFCIDPSRSRAAFERIYSGFHNTLTTDRYGAYNLYLGVRQACLAHIYRDFIKVSERPNVDGAIGRILCDQLDAIFALWHQYKAKILSREELQRQAQEFVENIKAAFICGATSDGLNSKTAALCNDLLDRFEMLWTFLYQENVEPTNNLAERGLRPAVICRKITGGSQSKWGMTFIERLLTVVCTFRQQAKNIFTFLTETFHSHIVGGPAPPVLTF